MGNLSQISNLRFEISQTMSEISNIRSPFVWRLASPLFFTGVGVIAHVFRGRLGLPTKPAEIFSRSVANDSMPNESRMVPG
jgi:hypothetical protein